MLFKVTTFLFLVEQWRRSSGRCANSESVLLDIYQVRKMSETWMFYSLFSSHYTCTYRHQQSRLSRPMARSVLRYLAHQNID